MLTKEQIVEDVEEPQEINIVEELEEQIIDYSTMTVPELKALAKEKGIENYSTMKKAELIEKLG